MTNTNASVAVRHSRMKTNVKERTGKVVAAVVMALTGTAIHAQLQDCASIPPSLMRLQILESCAASAKPGQISYLTKLGDIYFYGGRPLDKPDKPRGIVYYKRAAESGDSEIQLKLAKALKETGAPLNIWLPWIEKAALQSNKAALDALTMGERKLDESTKPEDRTIGELYRQALTSVATQSKLEDDQYQRLAARIGYMHEKGAGASPNSQEALNWYIRSAERGGYQSLWFALRMYKQGNGIPRDDRRAEQLLNQFFSRQRSFFEERPDAYLGWLGDAAELGFSSAALRLAEIYDKGLFGVPENKDTAANWKRSAQEAKLREGRGQ